MRVILGALAFLAAAAPSSAFAPSSSLARRTPWTARASERHGKAATVVMLAEKEGEVEQEVTDLNLEDMFEVSRAIEPLPSVAYRAVGRTSRLAHFPSPPSLPPQLDHHHRPVTITTNMSPPGVRSGREHGQRRGRKGEN